MRWLAVIGLLLALCLPAQAARLALVIGNKDYSVGPLKNPLNDAEDMAAALGGLGFQVTLVKNLKRDDIGRTVEAFANRIRPGDDALVFYAGHGLQVKGVNYLPAVDARIAVESDVPLNSLNLNELLQRLDDAKAGVRLLLVDACRDNPYSRGFRSNARGLARVEGAPSGTLMHFATRPGGVADDGGGRNGVYTAELLKHLRSPGLPVESMLKRVASGVRQATGGSQQPWTEGALDGEFYFASGPGPGPGPASQPDARPPLAAPVSVPAPVVAAPQAGQVVKDCADCPELVLVPPGSFSMGSPADEAGRADNEGPVRRVSIPRMLAVGRTEVTVGQYLACAADGGCAEPQWRERGSKYHVQTGTDDHYRKLGAALMDVRHPVVGVSHQDAMRFVQWLQRKTGLPYRLLTEAEWEYAARAGSTARWSFGEQESALGDHAWHVGNSGGRTQPVGTKRSNAFGLHDMHGNVWEWVQDVWHDNYQGAPTDGSAWTSGGDQERRVLRGGSWSYHPLSLRSAKRDSFSPGYHRYSDTGFRIARTF